MRIAVGGIHTECSTYSPVLMQADDFRVLRSTGLTSHDYFAFLRDYPAAIVYAQRLLRHDPLRE